ncbi:hypothetical protein ACFL2C_02240 [Patescibacteria group bacterium]
MLLIDKPITKTPLQCIKNVRENIPKLRKEKIAYAGRLDPMAHGLLLLLVGPETKNRHNYQNIDKKYEFGVLFGISTDTYDLMGIPKFTNPKTVTKNDLENIVLIFSKTVEQPYPPYSSKTVNGKPLYWYAKNKKMRTIKIPTKQIEVFDLKFLGLKKIGAKQIRNKVRTIKTVDGDFRQEKIMEAWDDVFSKYPKKNYQIAKFTIHCSSGTYVRQITHDMGRKLRIGSLAYDIKRTRIGEFKLKDTIKLEFSS